MSHRALKSAWFFAVEDGKKERKGKEREGKAQKVTLWHMRQVSYTAIHHLSPLTSLTQMCMTRIVYQYSY